MKNKIFKINASENIINTISSTILINSDSDIVIIAEGTSQRIINLLDGKRDINTIVNILYTDYPDTPSKIIFNDVCEYITLLCKNGICEQVN